MSSRNNGESVFDRLYKSSTASSAHKGGSPPRKTTTRYSPTNYAKPNTSPRTSPREQTGASSSVFDRLYKTSTSSSASKTHSPTHHHHHAPVQKRKPAVSSPAKTRQTTTPRSSPTAKSASPKSPATDRVSPPTKASKGKYSYQYGGALSPTKLSAPPKSPSKQSPVARSSPAHKMPATTATTSPTVDAASWKLTYTSKGDTKSPKTVSPLSPQELKVGSILDDFELGLVDEQTVAHKIITALFQRDFMQGKYWDIASATASRIEGDDGVVKYEALKKAAWDWNDIHSVASAKGTICFFQKDEAIRVEEYSYCVAG